MITVKITITADTGEDARKQLNDYASTAIPFKMVEYTHETIPVGAPTPEPEIKTPPKAKTSSKKGLDKDTAPEQPDEAVYVEAPNETIIAPELPNTTVIPSNDPLASTPSSDPLNTAPAVSDPLASTPAAGGKLVLLSDPLKASGNGPARVALIPHDAEVVLLKDRTDGKITLDLLRDKIGKTAPANRTKVKELLGQYSKADGKPVAGTSELQEKDYQAVWDALDSIQA